MTKLNKAKPKQKPRVVAVIPARGGSKGIPNKNQRPFCKKPLIAWSIQAAFESVYVDRIIVSTDSPEIARVARRFKAEVPFLRPEELATDSMGIEPVLKHAYEWLIQNEDYKADALVLLLPTNPLRLSGHIDKALEIYFAKGADSVVAVNETPANHTPFWTLVRGESGRVMLFNGKPLTKMYTRRQQFPARCFARNEIVFVVKPANLFEKTPNLYGNKVELLETNPLFEGDINTPLEWEMTEHRFRQLRAKEQVEL